MNILALGSWHSRLTTLALLFLALAILPACGRKGPVRPPLASLPAAPAETRIDQQGDDFLLSWEIPAVNQDGGPAEDLIGFHLYRLIYTAADGCPTCRDPEELVAAIMLKHPEPAARIGKRLHWRDAAVAPGTGHAYLVVPITLGGREGTGTGIHRPWQAPPPPPTGVQVAPREQGVHLSWSPPAALPDGQVLAGYNLYRRPVAGIYPPIPLNAEPLSETQLTDLAGEAGREAAYRVTTVAKAGELLVESAPSPEVAAAPQKVR